MYTNNGHYCCDTFDFARIQFEVAIIQAKKATGRETRSINPEQKLIGERNAALTQKDS
jgi:hypothetical protein